MVCCVLCVVWHSTPTVALPGAGVPLGHSGSDTDTESDVLAALDDTLLVDMADSFLVTEAMEMLLTPRDPQPRDCGAAPHTNTK